MMHVNGVLGAPNGLNADDPMDLDEPAQSRHTEAADQVVIDAMDLCERAVVPYDDRGFFMNMPENCLIHVMTYLTLQNLKILSETSKESGQTLKAIFVAKDQWIKNLTPLWTGQRFILESLGRSQKEIEERLQILDEARIFMYDLMAALDMRRDEITEGLSYGLFEGSLYRFSLHRLALKKAYEAYNLTAPQNKKLTLKEMFEHYDHDRREILEAVKRGTAKSTDLFWLKSLVTPPEISQMRFLTELCCNFSGAVHVIPKEIYSFTKLTKLTLQSSFQSLSADIQNLTQLTYLSLCSSSLQSLPPEIGELSQLEELHLPSCGNLRSLPESIVRLELEVLDLTNSGIVIRELSASVRAWIRKIPTVYWVYLTVAGCNIAFHPRELEEGNQPF